MEMLGVWGASPARAPGSSSRLARATHQPIEPDRREGGFGGKFSSAQERRGVRRDSSARQAGERDATRGRARGSAQAKRDARLLAAFLSRGEQ